MVGEGGGCGGGLLPFGGMEVGCVVVSEGEMMRRWGMWDGHWGGMEMEWVEGGDRFCGRGGLRVGVRREEGREWEGG